MATIRPRNDPVRLLFRRLLMLGILILILFAIDGVWTIYLKDKESLVQRREAEVDLKDLAQRKDRLTADIRSLDTDRGKEEALRGQYEIGKQGEGLIIIVDEKPATTTPPVEKKWYEKVFPWW